MQKLKVIAYNDLTLYTILYKLDASFPKKENVWEGDFLDAYFKCFII